MKHANEPCADVTAAINDLIKAGTQYDIAALQRIYHDTLSVIMIDSQGKVSTATKGDFLSLFETKLKNAEPPLNTWAQFKHVTADAHKAHVLINRKVKLAREEQKLTLSIDLMHQDGRWQVVREVIFVQPEA